MLKINDFAEILYFYLQDKKDARALLSISGGRDSMFLLEVYKILYENNLIPAPYIFNLDHKLRLNSKRDTELVKNICEKYNFKFFYKEKKISNISRKIKLGIEETARFC